MAIPRTNRIRENSDDTSDLVRYQDATFRKVMWCSFHASKELLREIFQCLDRVRKERRCRITRYCSTFPVHPCAPHNDLPCLYGSLDELLQIDKRLPNS